MIEKLRNDHLKLKQIAANLLEIVESDTPCHPKVLAICRWELARLMLQHLPVEDRYIYRRLETDSRAGIAAIATRFKQELEVAYANFDAHTQLWTEATIFEKWPDYRQAVRKMVAFLVDRIDREEATLFPLVGADAEPPRRQPGDRNWAEDGWKIRDRIHGAQ